MISQIIWDVSPNIFQGFEFLRWYGVCWLLGTVSGYWVMIKIYKTEDLQTADLETLVTYVMIGAVIGARLGHVLFYDPVYYWNHPIQVLPIKLEPTFQFTGMAGMASHGGVIGALLALYFYNRRYKTGYLWTMDRLAIASAALFGFIRIGNLINSEIFGKPSELPWAFVFVKSDNIPRHPTQIYEALLYFGSGIILFLLWKHTKYTQFKGFIFGLGLVLMGTQRFLIEFLKENQVAFENQLFLNMGQLLSIPLILSGIGLMIWSHNNFKHQEPTH